MKRLAAIESPSSAVASRVPATNSARPGPTASATCPSIEPTGNCGSRTWTTSPVLAWAAKVRTKSLVTEKSLLTTARVVPGRSLDRDSSRSEEHTSELQSRQYLVCRLLLEKKQTMHLLT